MKRILAPLIVFLFALVLWASVSGCATTYAMKISAGRAGTDLAVTQMIEWKVLSREAVVLLVKQLRDALANAENIPEYMKEVHAATAPYLGGKQLEKFLLKTLPEYAFKIEDYRFGLTQCLNQAELAAVNYRVTSGGSP